MSKAPAVWISQIGCTCNNMQIVSQLPPLVSPAGEFPQVACWGCNNSVIIKKVYKIKRT